MQCFRFLHQNASDAEGFEEWPEDKLTNFLNVLFHRFDFDGSLSLTRQVRAGQMPPKRASLLSALYSTRILEHGASAAWDRGS